MNFFLEKSQKNQKRRHEQRASERRSGADVGVWSGRERRAANQTDGDTEASGPAKLKLPWCSSVRRPPRAIRLGSTTGDRLRARKEEEDSAEGRAAQDNYSARKKVRCRCAREKGDYWGERERKRKRLC